MTFYKNGIYFLFFIYCLKDKSQLILADRIFIQALRQGRIASAKDDYDLCIAIQNSALLLNDLTKPVQ